MTNQSPLQANGWQPIETAPKDGTYIWLGKPHRARIGFWQRSQDRWADLAKFEGMEPAHLDFEPTAWMSLPTPPEEESE